MLGQKSDRRHYPASMTGLVASALGAPKVVVEACPGRRITCCATSALIQPATQKCLREYPSAERAVASGTAGEVFAGVAISVPASMSLAALIAVKSEAASHPAWGSDARPIRRLPVCVWNPWDA